MISIKRMEELALEECKKTADKCGKYHFGTYRDYFTCSKCKNASWYDDSYCNNQSFLYEDSPHSNYEKRYCCNYERNDK